MNATHGFCIVATCALLAAACARSYDLARPPSFRPYEDSSDVKMITPDGVMLKVREIDNYPEATLEFWTDAMSQHLERQGYALTSKSCFKTQAGLDGCSLDFLLPHGAEDWMLKETLFVKGDTIYLVEAAGPYDHFAKVSGEVDRALKTFRLRE